MYDDESIFWFRKGGFCVLSRAEKFENVAGGNLSVLPSWSENVTSGVTSRVAKWRSRVGKVTEQRRAQWCGKDVYQVPLWLPNNASFYAIWKAALTSFLSVTNKKMQEIWHFLRTFLPGKPPGHRVLCDSETSELYTLVISGWMKSFVVQAHISLVVSPYWWPSHALHRFPRRPNCTH